MCSSDICTKINLNDGDVELTGCESLRNSESPGVNWKFSSSRFRHLLSFLKHRQ